MHTVYMSSFRVLTKARSQTSFKLGELNNDTSFNAYEIIKEMINQNLSIPLEDSDTKLIVSIPSGNLSFDDQKRTICGYVNAGRYGENYTVRQKKLSSPSHKKVNHDEVTERKRYVFMYIPDSLDTGIIAFHDTGRLNARNPIKKMIELGFKSHNPSFEARVRPLMHQSIPQGIKNSDVLELKAVGYKVSKDTADAMQLIGNRTTAEIVIKNKGYSLGKISDFLGRSPSQNDLLDILEKESDQIKITAQINGKNKVYVLDDILSKGVSITLDDTKLNIDPLTNEPSETSLHNEIKSEINDFLSAIYGSGYSI